MRARDFLDAADRLPLVSLDTLLGDGGAVVMAPHPDDESLGCGALIAEAVAAGRKVKLVFLSDGAGSHPDSKNYPPARLRDLREGEARDAARTLGLGPDDLTFLRMPDRFVPSAGPTAEAAARAIAKLCRDVDACALFVTWRYDPHCDHQAAYAIARDVQREFRGARLFEYPIWGRSLPDHDDVSQSPAGFRLNGAARLATKLAAIACHRSQWSDLIDDDPEGFRLSAEELRRLGRSDEVFLECHP